MAEKPQVLSINLENPIQAIGKVWKGDYSKSKEVVGDVKRELEWNNVPFLTDRVLAVYYDNPHTHLEEELLSFQGLILTRTLTHVPTPFSVIHLEGRLLYVKIPGEGLSAMYKGYEALFQHVLNFQTELKSPIGYQITSQDRDYTQTEIYLQLK